MSDPRVDSLVDEAMRLRLSRRSIMRRGAALGLSTAAVAGVLSTTGRVSAAPRAAAPPGSPAQHAAGELLRP